MASLPARPSQQPSQPPQQPASQQQHLEREDTAPSMASIDSQTVYLDDAPGAASTSDAQQPEQPPAAPQRTVSSSGEPSKCWICFADETEDTAETSAWVRPCACALTAHEACILDWVADLEAPQNRRRAAQQIACPQCKTPLRIERPRSLVVSGVAGAERALGKLTVPGLLATALGAVAAGAWVHGLASVYVVFGADDFAELLGVGSDQGTALRAALGTALVPVALVASRLRVADGLLPMLPVFFLAPRFPSAAERSRGAPLRWPPSAAMAFASLPYLRGVYNELWRQLFAAHERRWVAELQPRIDGDGDGDEGDDQPEAGDGVVELELEFIDQAPAGGDAAQAGGAQENNALHGRANRIVNTSGRVADAVMGALCFPVVAAAAGELLRVSLPPGWVAPAARGRLGMLQTRWGRSLVGGCLFVVVKDFLTLYSKYRMAQNHRKRHVMNYDRRRNVGR